MANKDIINHYAALDIEDENADEATIKKAYRKLVLKWHPDKHPEDRVQAEEKIRIINAAYEVLSNPTKKATYDQQKRAVKRRNQGFGPPPTGGAPRMRIPKEFMMMPIGYPDKFIRYQGCRLAVNSRRDAQEVEFQAFFEDTKWSLWWLPEVNNMCRIRALGSKARGEKMGVSAGLCGGLNLSFYIDPMNPTDSEVSLEDARKGEKVDKVNFITVTSPAYEGAFRFEAAYRRGYYLTFLPPNHVRVAPLDEKEAGIVDFALVDFGIMFKFIEMEEVLQPAVSAYSGWVPLADLRKDRNVLTYFQNILQKPVWDNDDFMTYFEGHWETWEFDKEAQAVRLRTPAEKLAQLLNTARTSDDTAAIIAGAKEELCRVPLATAVKALVVLATEPKDSAYDVSSLINRLSAQKKLLSNLAIIVSNEKEKKEVLMTDLLEICELTAAVGGPNPGADLLQIRQGAQAAVADIIFRQLPKSKSILTSSLLSKILRLPGASSLDAMLSSLSEGIVADIGVELALDLVKNAGAANCPEVASTFASSALLMLDGRNPEPGPNEQVATLKILATAGAALEEVATRLQALAPVASVSEVAAVILCLGDRGFSSSSFSEAVASFSNKADLSPLSPATLLQLAVASTKAPSLAAVVGAVARAVSVSPKAWPTSDLVRLLLALAKAKGALKPDDKRQLLQRAAKDITPELASLPTADLVKLVLAIAADGESQLIVAAAEEALGSRISGFPQAQLLILTQGLAQALGATHDLVQKAVDFWVEVLSESSKGDDDDEVTKRRRELELRSRLTADQLVQLAKVTGAGGANNKLIEQIGNQLLTAGRAKELTDAGKKAAEAQLTSLDSGLAKYSKRDRLKRFLTDGQARSRSRSRRRRSPSRSRRRSRSRDRRDRDRDRDRDRRYDRRR